MAIVAVQDYRRGKEDNTQKLLSKIASGLQIAQGLYGLKTMTEQSELRNLQVQREQQALETGKYALEEKQRKAGLETAGIIPSSEFNVEFRAVDEPKIAELEAKSGLSLEPIRVKVEDPTSPEGFVERLAIPKDELSEVRKLIKQEDLAKLRLSTQERIAQMGKSRAVQLAQAAAGGAVLPKKVDDQFSTEFAKYNAQGDEAKNYDTIIKLEETLADAEQKLSGGVDEQLMGIMPDKVRDLIDSEDKSIEDRIKAVAQTSLKQILGAQFTEKEGKMILDRAYNPAQPKEENMRRMRELVRSLRSQADAKKQAMDYFAQHGTLQGFTRPQPSAMPGAEPITRPTRGPTMMGTMGVPAAPAKKQDSDFINSYLSE